MVRSSSSCFKIIACGGDAASEDGFERIESKGSTDKRENSTDKRGWSFRKKSDRHRKTTILEDSSAGNTENPDATGIDFHGQPSSTIVEKAFTSQREEVIPLSKDVSSKAPEILILQENVSKIDPIVNDEVGGDTGSLSIMKNADDVDPIMDESLAIIIQAAIRGYLSQKALLKIKNVVKLQAAVRGHLVRSQAVGSLRCVQAIVKIQSFVRARRTRILLEGPGFDAKLDDRFGESDQNPSTLEKERKEEQSFYCTEKLLRNAFARQLLESTSRKRPIHINCDPLRPDSTWRWLERWMSASSSSSQESQLDLNNDKLERQLDGTVCGLGIDAPGEFVSETTKLNSCFRETTMHSDDEEDLTNDRDKFDFQFTKQAVSSKEDEAQQSQLDGTCLGEENRTSINKTEQPPNVASEVVVASIPRDTEADNEQLKHSMKRIALEEPEIEGKKVVGSKKASNPAFVAAQSKFKELSSTTMSTNSASKDMEGELKIGRILSRNDSQPKNAESTVSVNSFSHDPRFHLGESEIDATPRSSTLDSPVRSEVRGSEKEIDSKVFEEVSSDLNRTDGKPSNMETQDGEYAFGQPASPEIVNGVASLVNVESRQSDTGAPNLHIKHDIPVAMAQPTYGSSPEGSIRSRLTVPESHGTPSSQVSVKAKRKESSKSDSAGKRKSKSADKRSPSNANYDPVTSDGMEKLSKDSKNGKRRNSFGATKTDHVDQEPRESNSASLPSYMQATKSARAKAQANNSPRSSPDVQDNDVYLKKRHSLPSAIGKQGSPRMPSSSPQAQQITKGDQSHSSRDKWQR